MIELMPPPPFTKGRHISVGSASFRRSYSPSLTASIAHDLVQNMAHELTLNKRPGKQESTKIMDEVYHRRDYRLGDSLRCPSHVIIEPTYEQAERAVSALDKYGYAFIRRSNGLYTYAIVASRTVDRLIFVVDEAGSTKKIPKRNWCEDVRLPKRQRRISHSMEMCHPIQGERVYLCQEVKEHWEIEPQDDSTPPFPSVPRVISFNSMDVEDDECLSLISSVSDRAR